MDSFQPSGCDELRVTSEAELINAMLRTSYWEQLTRSAPPPDTERMLRTSYWERLVVAPSSKPAEDEREAC